MTNEKTIRVCADEWSMLGASLTRTRLCGTDAAYSAATVGSSLTSGLLSERLFVSLVARILDLPARRPCLLLLRTSSDKDSLSISTGR